MAAIRKVRKRRARTKEDTMNLKHRHPHRRHIQGPIGTALIALTLLPSTIDVTPCAKLVPSTAVLSVILQQPCPLMAQSRHAQTPDECPLFAAKRTLSNRCLPILIYEQAHGLHPPEPNALVSESVDHVSTAFDSIQVNWP